MANCSSCGAPINGHYDKCPYCGTLIPKPENNKKQTPPTTPLPERPAGPIKRHNRERYIAILLAFFVGSWGGDLFYLGKTKRAIIILAIGLTGFFAIFTFGLAIIRMLKYVSMSDRRFDESYNY